MMRKVRNIFHVNRMIIDSNKNFINFYIMAHNNNVDKYDKDNILWRGNSIYSFPKSNKKGLTCTMINNLPQRHSHPNWLIFGDLNLITTDSEKKRGNHIDPHLKHVTFDTFNACNMIDLGYEDTMIT